jgi:hypothetical protein
VEIKIEGGLTDWLFFVFAVAFAVLDIATGRWFGCVGMILLAAATASEMKASQARREAIEAHYARSPPGVYWTNADKRTVLLAVVAVILLVIQVVMP